MKKYSSAILSFLISGIVIGPVKAQSSHAVEMTLKLEDEILYMDSLFWQSYNACDIDKFKTFLTDDLEFYHDKGGLTTTLATFMESIESGLCGNENWRLRREVVEGSVKVFPVPDYGAIISGEHLFYIVENSTERLDGLATFVHVWQYKNGEWKMSRVLSYDHRPAPSTNIKEVVSLSDEVLIQYVGSYEGSQMGKRIIIISKENGYLKLKDDGFEVNIYPETENLFFHKERDLQFKFIKDGKQKVTKLVVLEKGAVVEQAKRIE